MEVNVRVGDGGRPHHSTDDAAYYGDREGDPGTTTRPAPGPSPNPEQTPRPRALPPRPGITPKLRTHSDPRTLRKCTHLRRHRLRLATTFFLATRAESTTRVPDRRLFRANAEPMETRD